MAFEIAEDPISLFHEWLDEAKKSEINDPESFALATSTKDGKVSVRMILLKEADKKGFKFHTNEQSHKGCNLHENPRAALCFHWKTLRRQVRIEGIAEKVSPQEADEYFASRPYGRQIGAHASQQSRPLESREFLEKKIAELQKIHPEGTDIPRPPYWAGYRVVPEKIEFWWDNPDRLHDRLLYRRLEDDKWSITRLYP